MVLDIGTLSQIIHGAYSVTEEEGRPVIRRYSEKQVESLWGKMTSQQRRPTSVYLEFETDAENLHITYDSVRTDASVGMLNFTLFENGCLTNNFSLEHVVRPKEEKFITFPDGEVEFKLQSGMKKVTVYLPLMEIALKTVSITDGAKIIPCKRSGTMAVYGDSISEGFFSEVAGMSYFDQLCRELDCEGFNFAVGGSKFRPEYIPENSVPACDRYLVAFGTNDFRRGTKEEFADAMPEFFKRLIAQVTGKPVYVILPIWRKIEEKSFELGDLFSVREAIAKEASQYPNAVIINGRELSPCSMAFMHDGTHPNALGHTHYALNLKKRILSHEEK